MRSNRFVLVGLPVLGATIVLLMTLSGTKETDNRGSGRFVDQQVNALAEKLKAGSISAAEQQTLLERLLSLGRLEDAQLFLESRQADGPLPLNQRLLLVDLMRLNGDLNGADQELGQLSRLHPNQLDVLTMQALVLRDRGDGVKAINQLKARYEAAGAGRRTELGLLLADLILQSDDLKQAEALYKSLAAESSGDARPVLALAMIRAEQGRPEAVRQLLAEAELRRAGPGRGDAQIEALAAAWGVSAARVRVGLTEESSSTVPP